MKISTEWLNRYFEKAPNYEDVVLAIGLHSFEIEGEEDVGGDKVIDIDILPNRAGDASGHMGVAKEVGTALDLQIVEQEISDEDGEKEIKVNIEDGELCRRYIGQLVENIEVKESPAWIKKSLTALGQRPINNIVDITNYVLFDFSQPMHAFDADKVVGGVTVRGAKEGERITFLDGEKMDLSGELIIADDDGPLALAGVKGGTKAEVTPETKNIIFEAASFDPVHIRVSSQRAGIRTDASKRFENNVSPELSLLGMKRAVCLLKEDLPEAVVGKRVDVYTKEKEDKEFSFEASDIERVLGVEVPSNEIERILTSLGVPFKKEGDKYLAKNPPLRNDLNIKEDIIEEVGRIYGYHNLKGVLPEKTEKAGDHKNFLINNALRGFFLEKGFSEIYGYAFESKGELEVENPLAKGKEFLRTTLSSKLIKLVDFNLQHTLFDTEPVKMFEVGAVFPGDEELHCAFTIGYRKKKFNKNPDEVSSIVSELEKLLPGIKKATENITDVHAVIEFSLENISADNLKETDLSEFLNKEVKYQNISPYPRIIRDVALFVSTDTKTEDVKEMIKERASELLFEGPALFDEFEKDGKRSLAFRYSLQSHERTLQDFEATNVHEGVISALEKVGFEVRK